MPTLRNQYPRCAAAALLVAAACGDDKTSPPDDSDSGTVDGADARSPAGDANDTNLGADGGALADGSALPDSTAGNTLEGDAGCEATNSCAAVDPLAPFALNCANLPTANRACMGGPREVLLVMQPAGRVAMFDPTDGHFLGYFKHEVDSHFTIQDDGYVQATQGPDQCIWTTSTVESELVQRWNTDGSFKDQPLEQHYLPAGGGSSDDPVISQPLSLAFTADAVYVANDYGNPAPRLAKFTLPTAADGQLGKYQSTVLSEANLEVVSVLALGDGSLVFADGGHANVTRLYSDGTRKVVFKADLQWPGDVTYAGNGQVLVVDTGLGEPNYSVDLETGEALTIPGFDRGGSNKYGLWQLKNGNWLVSGGDYYVSVLEPTSMNPRGQNHRVWDDSTPVDPNFQRIGRACLPEEFVASRAPTAAEKTCMPAPSGATLFAENFESGQFTGSGAARHFNSFYDRATGHVTVSTETGSGTNMSTVLKIVGGEPYGANIEPAKDSGVWADISPIQPTYVSYDVQTASGAGITLGTASFENASAVADWSYSSVFGTYVFNQYFRGDNSNAASDSTISALWHHVELRNFNWTDRTYDLYLDCTRIAERIYMPLVYGEKVDRIHLYNIMSSLKPGATAWYDNIVVK